MHLSNFYFSTYYYMVRLSLFSFDYIMTCFTRNFVLVTTPSTTSDILLIYSVSGLFLLSEIYELSSQSFMYFVLYRINDSFRPFNWHCASLKCTKLIIICLVRLLFLNSYNLWTWCIKHNHCSVFIYLRT